MTGPQPTPSLGGPSPAVITSTAPRPIFQVGAVTVSLGGFVELAGIFRSRNEVTSVGTNWSSGIPLNNLPQAHQGEFRFTGQQSRVAALVQGQPDEVTKLTGYVEADFLGAAPTANSNESNSYTPRLRQFFAPGHVHEADDKGKMMTAGHVATLLGIVLVLALLLGPYLLAHRVPAGPAARAHRRRLVRPGRRAGQTSGGDQDNSRGRPDRRGGSDRHRDGQGPA